MFDVSVRARLQAYGRDIHEFHIADRSCEVAFVVLNQGGPPGVPLGDGGRRWSRRWNRGCRRRWTHGSRGEQREVQVFVAGADFCQFDPNSEGSVTLDGGNVVAESDEANNTGGWLIIG